MIRCNANHTIQRLNLFNNLSGAGIHGFHGLYRGFHDTGMPYHIRICKVQDHYIVFIFVQCFKQRFRHQGRTHFRLQVVGRDFRRRYQDTVFPGIGLFHAAVKEEGYMSVFFRFRNTQLLQAVLGQHFAQRIFVMLRRIRGRNVDGRIVLGHADHMHRPGFCRPFKIRELFIMQRTGNFPGPVRAEIIEDHAVTLTDTGSRFFSRVSRFVFLRYTERHYELIVHTRFIGSLNAFCSGSKNCTVPQNHIAIGFFQTFPAFIPVHGIIAAADRCKTANAFFLHKGFQILHIRNRALGRHIPAVQKSMYINLLQSCRLCHFQQRFQMINVTVNAAVTEQAHQVQRTVLFFCMPQRIQQHLVLKETAFFDGMGNQGQVLINDPARPDVQMPYFRIPNLTSRQPYIFPAGLQLCVGIIRKVAVQVRGTGCRRRIVRTGRGNAPAVQNH